MRLGGLSSGLDVESVIAQLMAVERQPLDRITGAQKRAEGRKTALEDVARSLRAMRTAATDLRSTLTWTPNQSVSTSDATRVGARVTGAAPVGSHVVQATQLARSEQRTYDFTQQATDTLTVNGRAITGLPANATAQQTADAINATADTGVVATVNGTELILSAKQLGQAISLSSSSGSLVEDTAKRQAFTSTIYTVNGEEQPPVMGFTATAPSLPGVELTFRTTSAATIVVGEATLDADKVAAKAKAFVDAYNSTVDLIRAKTAERRVANPATNADWAKGSLYGDVGLTGLLGRLRAEVAAPSGADPATLDRLSEIGIAVAAPQAGGGTISADRLAGKLAFDETKFKEALRTDAAGVQALLGAGGQATGFSQRVEGVLEPLLRAGTGVLDSRTTETDTELSRLRRRYEDVDRRLGLKEQRLRETFTRMETAMSASQAQMGWLRSQIAGLGQ
jgi:flagellar hook-associated protein 2